MGIETHSLSNANLPRRRTFLCKLSEFILRQWEVADNLGPGSDNNDVLCNLYDDVVEPVATCQSFCSIPTDPLSLSS